MLTRSARLFHNTNLCRNYLLQLNRHFGCDKMSANFQSKLLPTPVKAQSDKKEYRSIELPNGLRALLIADLSYPLDKLDEEEQLEMMEEESDEESESDDEEMESEDEKEDKKSESGLKQSSAALCIKMGSFSDPNELPGLAHFLEHMVFMGSKKYEDENGFDDFIQRKGGFDNAHTDTEVTCFYFDVQRRSFNEAVDRFAQFFISPLMKKEAMTRERMAVHSEFQQAKPSDSDRKQQLLGTLAKDPDNPMGKFMWGNLESLSGKSDEEINKLLHQFKVIIAHHASFHDFHPTEAF